MDPQLGLQPLLSRLENKRQTDQVGYVQLLEGSDSFRGVLPGRSSHQGKPCKRHDCLDESPAGAQGVVEEFLDWRREVQASSKNRNNLQEISSQAK